MSQDETKPDPNDAAEDAAQAAVSDQGVPGADGPGTDGPGTDGPGTDGPGTDGPATDRDEVAAAEDAVAGGGGEEDADEEGVTEDETAPLKAEIDALKDQVLRAMAETENVRRRAARDREDAGKYAITGFARDLLSAIDNLRRALDSLSDEVRGDEGLSSLIAGIEMTERELIAAFERHGIRRIEPLGEKFDHNFHQAMFEVEKSGKPAGTVVQVVQAGYVIADRLLRPAMVGVAKGAKAAEAADDAPAAHIDTEV